MHGQKDIKSLTVKIRRKNLSLNMREKLKLFLLKTESNNTDCAYVLSYSVLDCSDGFGLCISTQTKTQKFLYSAGGDESMHL